MKRITIFLLFITSFAFSQVGINTDTPDDSSILDVVSTDKGILIPRVPLQGVNDDATISAPATGLLVYKTGGATSMTDGFYYWDGSKWIPLRANSSEFWSPNGNEVATDAFIGTTNNEPLIIKINNVIVGRIKVNGGLDLGEGANSSENGIAIGNGAQSWNSTYGISIGRYANSSGNYPTAVGVQAQATGDNTTAFGHLAKATSKESVAFGAGAEAGGGNSATAIGSYAKATEEKAFALGPNTKATATNAFALGIGTIADKKNTIILGQDRNKEHDSLPEPAAIFVGIGTKNPKARLDVNGQFKLGERGNHIRNVIGFETTLSSAVNVPQGGKYVLEVPIPAENQLFTVNGTVNFTLQDSAATDDIIIASARFKDTGTVRVILRNPSSADISLNGLKAYISIVEFGNPSYTP